MALLKYTVVTAAMLMLIFVPARAAEASMGFYYQLEDAGGVNRTDLFGVEFASPLTGDFLMEASAATGSIIGDQQALLLKAGLFKRLPGPKDYYLGAGYKYFTDEQSTFETGGSLTKSMLFVKMKGFNQVDRLLLSTEISYAPFAFYNFRDTGNERMSAWDIKLGFDTLLSESISVILRGSLGGENYGSFSCYTSSFTLGMGYDI